MEKKQNQSVIRDDITTKCTKLVQIDSHYNIVTFVYLEDLRQYKNIKQNS